MTDWIARARAALAAEEPAMILSVVATRGSAPRGPGAHMLVTATAQAGTIGCGNLEFTAIAEARRLLAQGTTTAELRHFALGPALDQCCGGIVRLLFTPLGATLAPLFAEDIAPGRWLRATLGTGVPAPLAADAVPRGGEIVVCLDREGRPLDAARVTLDEIAELRLSLAPPRPRLYMFGAGHVGRALAHILALLPLEVRWIDARPDAFPDTVAANVRPVPTADWRAEVDAAPPGALYLVFTHAHPLDYAITAAILAREDARYCGLIGSETKRARFVKRFREEAGLSEAAIGRLVCPIGLGGPPGKEPEAIAIGVAAELLHILHDEKELAP